jgi:uncharacterized protein
VSTTQTVTQPEEPHAPALVVAVSADLLVAHLELTAGPADGATPPTLEEALASLARANVTFGINQARVAAALETPGRPILVALGQSPRDGEDGRVVYEPSLLAIGGRPHVADDGEVSLFDLGLVHNVEAGAVLATRTSPTPGVPGVTVFGKPIPARAGRATHLRAGAGARLGEDGLQVFAATAGHAVLVGDLVTVSPIYHVRGDVGPATGNITFVGSVIVSGNVDAGYRVEAGGDVEIQGSVAAGEIEAGGNVSVRYGIQGHKGHGRVGAAGVVRAKFIEFALVQAGVSVYASDGVMRSTVEAGEKVEVLGHHGSIVGGRILARHAVSARHIGSPHGVPTEIMVGTDPALVAEAEEARARATRLINQLEQIQQRIVQLQSQDRQRGLSAAVRQDLEKFHLVYRSLLEQRTDLNKRQLELAALLQALRGAVVIAQGTCHPEVRISIGTATHLVREAWHGVRFERNLTTYEIDLIGVADTSHS